MPRKSSAALSVVTSIQPHAKSRLLRAPAGLSPRAAEVFRDLIAGTAPEHFIATDLPLLARYAEAVALAEQSERELHKRGPVMPDGKVNPWNTVLEKAGRSVVALSMRLRLSPQSRTDPKTVTRRANGPKPSAYEMMDLDNE